MIPCFSGAERFCKARSFKVGFGCVGLPEYVIADQTTHFAYFHLKHSSTKYSDASILNLDITRNLKNVIKINIITSNFVLLREFLSML